MNKKSSVQRPCWDCYFTCQPSARLSGRGHLPQRGQTRRIGITETAKAERVDVLKGDDRGASGFVPGATLKGYERLDLHAFYNGFKPFRIALQVRNVFDERYVEGTDLR